MEALKLTNLGLAFLLELCAMAAFGYWGIHLGQTWISKTALGLGTPLAMATFWGLYLAPRATTKVPEPWHLLLVLIIFGLAVVALQTAKQGQLAWMFALVVALNTVLALVWRQ